MTGNVIVHRLRPGFVGDIMKIRPIQLGLSAIDFEQAEAVVVLCDGRALFLKGLPGFGLVPMEAFNTWMWEVNGA